MNAVVGLVVGSGFEQLEPSVQWQQATQTPYGIPSSPIGTVEFGGVPAVILARHGREHSIAPHDVNYRANLWVLHERGVNMVIAVNTVGAIAPGFRPGDVAVPDQLIDYTSGRDSTFGDLGNGIPHIDFTVPFDIELRGSLAAALAGGGNRVQAGTYGVTQGPRLETAAEIDRLERDGCGMVGMTAMPEAALARELQIRYALVACAVNYAAGRSPSGAPIHSQILQSATLAMNRVATMLETVLPGLLAPAL
jgi:5'-methylthioinosine phosphorylase